MQQNTCFEGCRYRDKKGKFRKTCPDYMELNWTNDTGEACTTEDCSRRRTLLMILGFDSRLIGVQQASEQERNTSHGLVQKLGEIIEISTGKKELANETCTLLSD